MMVQLTEIGVGYDEDMGDPEKCYYYWVQDFATDPEPPSSRAKIVEGSHAILSVGNITFIANYYDTSNDDPQEFIVVVNEQEYDMQLDIGEEYAGFYRKTIPQVQSCRPYYFVAVDGDGTTIRYPSSGRFWTFGEGGCED